MNRWLGSVCTGKLKGNNEKWKETFQTHCYFLTLSTVYFDGDFYLLMDFNQGMF
jgi:hypothetical protein